MKKISEILPGDFFKFPESDQKFYTYRTRKNKTSFFPIERVNTGKGKMQYADNNAEVIPA